MKTCEKMLAFNSGADCSRREHPSTGPAGFTRPEAPGNLGEDPPDCPSHLLPVGGAGFESPRGAGLVTGPPRLPAGPRTLGARRPPPRFQASRGVKTTGCRIAQRERKMEGLIPARAGDWEPHAPLLPPPRCPCCQRPAAAAAPGTTRGRGDLRAPRHIPACLSRCTFL